MRLLLVEDEQRLVEALTFILKKNRYLVDVAFDGVTGQEMAETGIYDLIILDRMLPGKEGVSIMKELRVQGIKTPVIFLTARDEVKDRVEGLDAGADDYLIKPFATEELIARIRALGRRQSEQLIDEIIQMGSLALNPLRCEAMSGDKKIKLSLKESQLLELFMRNKGQVLTKEQILNKIWGFDTEVDMNSVEIYIHYLRKKLDLQECRICIKTIRGIGYCLMEIEHVS